MQLQSLRRPLMRFFRRRRMALFEQMFELSSSDKVIDIGGTAFNWEFTKAKPSVLLVNLDPTTWERENLRKIQGDGRKLELSDHSFDIAFSNSVIEHVGTWEDAVCFAREVRRLAPRYFVQTPNKRFFVETHLMGFFIHLVPFGIARHLVRRFTLWGLIKKPSQERIDARLKGLRLMTADDLRSLFPDAEIHQQRVLGLVKSLIAFKK